MRGELRHLPPTLLHSAKLDVLAASDHAFAERLRQSSIALEMRFFPSTVHGIPRAVGRVSAADRAVVAAGAWLRGLFR